MIRDQTVGSSVADTPAVALASGALTFGIVLAFLLGVLLIYVGWHQYRTKRLIQGTPTETVRSLSLGRTSLVGSARPGGDPFDQPFLEGKAVLATYEIEEYDPDNQHETSDWRTRDSGSLLAPFDLDDGTGSVRIDPDETLKLVVSEGNTTTFEIEANEDEPAPVRRFLRLESSLDPAADGFSLHEEKCRYTQEVIPPDEEIFVFGSASEQEDVSGTGEELLVVGTDDETGRFVLSDRGEDALTSDMGSMAALATGLGVLLVATGVYFAITSFGIVG